MNKYNISITYCCNLHILQTEVEVNRLNVLKASKLKELIFKRQSELEEIYKGVHMEVDSDKARQILTTLMESGLVCYLFFYFQMSHIFLQICWWRLLLCHDLQSVVSKGLTFLYKSVDAACCFGILSPDKMIINSFFIV